MLKDVKYSKIEPLPDPLSEHRLAILKELIGLYDFAVGYGHPDQGEKVLKIIGSLCRPCVLYQISGEGEGS